MVTNSTKAPKAKGVQTDRQKRLSAALRENLRKRKLQSQDRQKSKTSNESSE